MEGAAVAATSAHSASETARSHVTTTAQLKFEARIGVGSRGQVFRARTPEGTCVGVKVMNRDDEETGVEVRALTRLQRHPHIVAMEGEVEYSPENAFVILEFAETDLLELVMSAHALNARGLEVDMASRYFAQLAKAVRHCHRRSVYHLDIKPENCLIKNGVLKLCDFGSASLRRRTDKASGSVYYAAPEVLPLFYQHAATTPMLPTALALAEQARSLPGSPGGGGSHMYDAAAADVWSMGVVLFVMLAGRPPWAEASYHDEDFVALAQGHFGYPDFFPVEACRLLRGMLQVQPKQRIGVADVLRDPWVTPFRSAEHDMAELQAGMMKHLRFFDADEDGKRRRHGHRRHRRRRHDADGAADAESTARPAMDVQPADMPLNVQSIPPAPGAPLLAHMSPGPMSSPQIRGNGAPQLSFANLPVTEPLPAPAQPENGVMAPPDVSVPIASPAPPLGGLRISIAATHKAGREEEGMDVSDDDRSGMACVRLPSGLSVSVAAESLGSHSTSRPTAPMVSSPSPEAGGSPATQRSSATGVNGAALSVSGSFRDSDAAGGSSTSKTPGARLRGPKVDRGSLTPGVVAPFRSPMSIVKQQEEPALRRSTSADLGMMAAMLRTNTDRAIDANADSDSGSVSTDCSRSMSSTSLPDTTPIDTTADERDRGTHPPVGESAMPVEPSPAASTGAPDILMERFGAPPAAVTVHAPSLPNMGLSISRPPALSSAAPIDSAPPTGGLSIRGYMSIHSTTATPGDATADSEEGLPPEAVGYGSKFAARRAAQMRAVQAALEAGSSIPDMVPVPAYHSSPREDVAVAPVPTSLPTAPGPFIPPSALAAISQASGTREGIPVPIRRPMLGGELASASSDCGRSTPTGAASLRQQLQLRRVAAIALPTNSPRATASSPGRPSQLLRGGRPAAGPSTLRTEVKIPQPASPGSLDVPAPSSVSRKGALAFVAAESLLEPESIGDAEPLFAFATAGGGMSTSEGDTSSTSSSDRMELDGALVSRSAAPASESATAKLTTDQDVHAPGFHLTRISSAARRAVEEHQSALGIGEGFELSAVQLLSKERKRRALAKDVFSAALSHRSDDGASVTSDYFSDAGDSMHDQEGASRSQSRASSGFYSESDYASDGDGRSLDSRSSAYESDDDVRLRGSARVNSDGFVSLLRSPDRGKRRGRRHDDENDSPTSGGGWSRGRERTSGRSRASLLHGSDSDNGSRRSRSSSLGHANTGVPHVPAHASTSTHSSTRGGARGASYGGVHELQDAFNQISISTANHASSEDVYSQDAMDDEPGEDESIPHAAVRMSSSGKRLRDADQVVRAAAPVITAAPRSAASSQGRRATRRHRTPRSQSSAGMLDVHTAAVDADVTSIGSGGPFDSDSVAAGHASQTLLRQREDVGDSPPYHELGVIDVAGALPAQTGETLTYERD